MHVPEDYPASQTLIECTSRTMPPLLIKHLTKLGTDEAQKQAGEGKPHLVAVVTTLRDFIATNLFVACWKEVRQVNALVARIKGSIQGEPEEGVLRIQISAGKYRCRVRFQVMREYPHDGTLVEIEKHNFPPRITNLHLLQTREIVRRCVAGYSPTVALLASNPIKAPPRLNASKTPRVSLTNETMHNIKHDVAVLKKVADLRAVNASKDKRNQEMMHSTQVRKDARRELRTLAKAEAASDEVQEQKMADLEAKQALAMQQRPSENPMPSLLAAADFLVSTFAHKLPSEPCQACGKCILPDDPKDKQLMDPEHPARPTRTFCGHWFHHNCLNEWLTNPPFIHQCPVCDRRIWHPDWPSDISVIERAWANKQAHKRELAEVKDFFQGEDFSAFS